MEPSMLNRAYSVVDIKSIDVERRVITGMATTPTMDRVGDVIEPRGAIFATTLPLLLFHDTTKPVGSASLAKATDHGIAFEAHLPDIQDPPALRDRIQEAWASVKNGLIKGVSIGFRALDDGVELLKTGGVRFTKIEILELSLVAIPANSQATIATIKQVDTAHLAASGTGAGAPSLTSPGASGTHATARKGARPMTINERKITFEAEKAAKVAKLNDLMSGADGGSTLDAQQQDEFDTIQREVSELDGHLSRLETLERVNKAALKPVVAGTPSQAAAAREPYTPVITVRDQKLPPGIAMARAVMCQVQAKFDGHSALEVAKSRYPSHETLHAFLSVKGAVPAGTTTQTVWAAPLAEPTVSNDFIEYLQPQTILGKFGTNGIPSLQRIPFNVKVPSQTSGGDGYWVGQGKAKPLTSFAFSSVTMLFTKVAAISVITEELARFSTPSAEARVRDSLVKALVRRLDIDFIDPAQAAVTGVNPASITFGVTPLSSAGPTAANAVTDLGKLLQEFVVANLDPSTLVLIMPNTLALTLSLMTNTLGQPDFPNLTMNGGTLKGIPVITSQHAANASGSGNLVIAVNTNDVFLADDGGVRVDASREASLEMSDAPTSNSSVPTGASLVSMFQTNSIAIRAERFINWQKARAEAVAFIDDVNWGSIGSP